MQRIGGRARRISGGQAGESKGEIGDGIEEEGEEAILAENATGQGVSVIPRWGALQGISASGRGVPTWAVRLPCGAYSLRNGRRGGGGGRNDGFAPRGWEFGSLEYSGGFKFQTGVQIFGLGVFSCVWGSFVGARGDRF